MPLTTSRKQLPSWVLPAVIAAVLLVLLAVGWKVLKDSNVSSAPITAVQPGMVDFHKEAQKGTVDRPRVEADEEGKSKGKEKDGDNDGDGK